MYTPIIITILGLLLGHALNNFMFTAVYLAGILIGYIARDYSIYIKSDPSKQKELSVLSLKEGEPIKEGEYQPIFIKIDKNEMGGYTSWVYNRHGTHLTKENRGHFVNILKHMISKEGEIRSHQFKLLTFRKDK